MHPLAQKNRLLMWAQRWGGHRDLLIAEFSESDDPEEGSYV